MLVDDNPLVLQAYSLGLLRHGFRVEMVKDSVDAMKIVLILKPDLVVLDLVMPKVDGSFVLKFIRSQPELKSVRVILLSDASDVNIARAAFEQKPDAAFLKSQCTASLLLDKINELLADANRPELT